MEIAGSRRGKCSGVGVVGAISKLSCFGVYLANRRNPSCFEDLQPPIEQNNSMLKGGKLLRVDSNARALNVVEEKVVV